MGGNFKALAGELVVGAALLSGCGADSQCDCRTPGVTLVAKPGQVASVTASGPACTNASIRCGGASGNQYQSGCEYYYVTPSAKGVCTIDVGLVGGQDQTKNFDIVHESGCCAGYFVQGNETWQLE